jgi:CO/xanthine dehydrogenase FAD-binding subunit
MTSRFAAPASVSEALAILAADRDARPLAGGTDLVVAARQGRKPLPESIVAIDRIAELAVAQTEAGGLVLGALTTHAWLAADPAVRSSWTALADAAAIVGSPATRGTGTLGGNLMNASPAAETTAPLVVLGATTILRGQGVGERRVAVADLAVGPGRTAAAPSELLTSVRVPRPAPGTGSAYVRLESRRAMEIAVVGAAVLVTLGDASGDGDRSIVAARVALTAVAPTVIRAEAAEKVLVGAPATGETARAAGAAAAGAATPIDDVRASADYRRAMLEVVVARTVAGAIARARGEMVPIPASRWAYERDV